VFQSAQTTLTEGQVQEFSARIVKALEEKLGAVLRTN
jgi:phenylalanyl-tRNA synthetase beta subunit